jgi:hypothetical protein
MGCSGSHGWQNNARFDIIRMSYLSLRADDQYASRAADLSTAAVLKIERQHSYNPHYARLRA